jgi:hypothetical protein
MWSAVGILLLNFAYHWIPFLSETQILITWPGGFVLGFVIFIFGFGKIAKKNIKRIRNLPSGPKVWDFQSPKSYLIIIFMVSLGIFLRKTPYVSRALLQHILDWAPDCFCRVSIITWQH